MLKNKISRNLKNKKKVFKAYSTPNFSNINYGNIFCTQKNYLESLTNIIKLNQLKYFSSNNNDNNFIVNFLQNLKESLLISFKVHNCFKEQIFKSVNYFFTKLNILE